MGKNRDKPLIGVSGPNYGGRYAWHFTALSVWLAGGRPVRITPENPKPDITPDGLILGGGSDVEPRAYGQERVERGAGTDGKRTWIERFLTILFFPLYWLIRYAQHTKQNPVDPDRDALEFRLLEECISENKPVLGICRGMQLMNVYFGGTLHQDIRGYYSEHPQVSTILPRKKITTQQHTRLHELLGKGESYVNALHNQAIDRLGGKLQVAARESYTNIIQAVEHREKPFVIGVQWHPEYLIQLRHQRRLFRELVNQANSK